GGGGGGGEGGEGVGEAMGGGKIRTAGGPCRSGERSDEEEREDGSHHGRGAMSTVQRTLPATVAGRRAMEDHRDDRDAGPLAGPGDRGLGQHGETLPGGGADAHPAVVRELQL